MVKYKGIWTNDLSEKNIKSLYNDGFNTIVLHLGYFWKQVENNEYFPSYEDKKRKMLQLYFDTYWKCKEIGFQKFFIDGGWGMNEEDAHWKIISQRLKDEPNIIMYAGEMIENFYEQQYLTEENTPSGKPWTREDVVNNVLLPRVHFDGRFMHDTTKRNFDFLNGEFPNKVSVSSYLFQSSKFHKNYPFVWVMGQVSWHIWNSWWYSILNYKIKKNNIDTVLLYQGNIPGWSSDGWESKILDILHLRNWIEKMRRKWFLYIFK